MPPCHALYIAGDALPFYCKPAGFRPLHNVRPKILATFNQREDTLQPISESLISYVSKSKKRIVNPAGFRLQSYGLFIFPPNFLKFPKNIYNSIIFPLF